MICSRCLQAKSEENFSFKVKEKGRRHTMCKQCHSDYRRQHYVQNKAKYVLKAKKWNSIQKRVLQQFLYRRLRKSACVDCGENDIVVLDFDHLSDKKFGIAQMFCRRYSVRAIKEELEKCVTRCANCHRRKTAKEVGYWKYALTQQLGA